MGQTCSLPCVDFLEESARVFAFPQYSATGCGAATYSSFLVVRSDLPGEELAEFAGATATVNDPHFQSGHTSLVMELERGGHRMPFFGRARVSRATRRRFGCSPRERPTLPRSIAFPTRTSSGTAIPMSARSGSSAGRRKRRRRRTSRSAAGSQISMQSSTNPCARHGGSGSPTRARGIVPQGGGSAECGDPCRNGSGSCCVASSEQSGNCAGVGFSRHRRLSWDKFQRRNPTRRIILVGGCVMIDCSGSRIPPSVRGVGRRSQTEIDGLCPTQCRTPRPRAGSARFRPGAS